MKKTIGIILLSTFILNLKLTAQVTLKVEKTFEHDKVAEIERMVGADETGIYALRVERNFKSRFYYIEKYNKTTFEKIYSTKIDLMKMKGVEPMGSSFYYDVMVSKKKVYFFFKGFRSEKNAAIDEKILFVKTIAEDGTLSADTKEVEVFKYPGEDYDYVNFTTRLSQDSSKILVVTKYKKREEKQTLRATLVKFSDLSQIWSKEISGDYKGMNIDCNNYSVDKNDNLTYTFTYSQSKDAINSAVAVLPKTSQTPKIVELKFEGSTDAILMKYTNTNKLVGAGVYYQKQITNKEKGYFDIVSGVFYFLLDVNQAVLLSSDSKLFTKDIASNINYISEKGFNPVNKQYEATALEEINGNFYYITEHSTNGSQSLGFSNLGPGGYSNSPGPTKAGTAGSTGKTNFSDYKKEEILVTKINLTSNKAEWVQAIPKYVSNSIGGSDAKLDNINGTYVLVSDKKLNIICLESPKVEEKIAKGKKMDFEWVTCVVNSPDANVVCFEIDENKKVNRSIIYTNKDMDCRPFSSSNNVCIKKGKSIAIYMLNGKKEGLGTITVQ